MGSCRFIVFLLHRGLILGTCRYGSRSPRGARTRGLTGVNDIETRTLVAYGLILLAAAAVAVGIAFARYNSRDRKIRRQRDRERDRVDLDDEQTPGP